MNINMAFPWAKRRRDDGAYWEFCIIFASILQVAPETIFQERAASARRVVFPSTNNEVIPKQVWRKGISRGETEQELRRRRCVAPPRVGLQCWTNAGRGSSSIYACTVFVRLQPLPPSTITTFTTISNTTTIAYTPRGLSRFSYKIDLFSDEITCIIFNIICVYIHILCTRRVKITNVLRR